MKGINVNNLPRVIKQELPIVPEEIVPLPKRPLSPYIFFSQEVIHSSLFIILVKKDPQVKKSYMEY